MSPDWADKPEAVPYSHLDYPQSLNLYVYVLDNPLTQADPDGHWPDCNVCSRISTATGSFLAAHPVAVGVARGLGNAALGAGTVAISVGGEAASGGLSTAVSVVGVMAGASLFVKGVTQAVGAATSTDVKEATEALDATRNPAGLVVTAATGGNLQAGDKAATALDVAASASDVKELGTQAVNGELKMTPANAVKATNILDTAHDAQTALKPQPEQKKEQNKAKQ